MRIIRWHDQTNKTKKITIITSTIYSIYLFFIFVGVQATYYDNLCMYVKVKMNSKEFV